MRIGPIFLLLATLGVVAWLAPHLDAGGGASPKNAVSAAADDDGTAKAAWFAGETELTLSLIHI